MNGDIRDRKSKEKIYIIDESWSKLEKMGIIPQYKIYEQRDDYHDLKWSISPHATFDNCQVNERKGIFETKNWCS